MRVRVIGWFIIFGGGRGRAVSFTVVVWIVIFCGIIRASGG